MAALCLSSAVFVSGPSKLSLKKAAARPAGNVSARPSCSLQIVAMTTPDLKKEVEQKISEAQETCADPNATAECAVAWDEVEELSAAASDAKTKAQDPANSDPLERFCEDNPEADECRVYSD